MTDTDQETVGPANRQPADFDPVAEGRRLLRSVRSGALATLDRDGAPLVTLVNVATDMDGAPILLVSSLSAHTRNLGRERRVSLLLADSGKGDPLAHPRLTVQGTAELVDRQSEMGGRIRRRFLARHPKSALYADFGDFSFRRIAPTGFHLNGGFARAADLPASALTTPITDAAALLAIEEEAIEHMNEDHADAVSLYAAVLCKAGDGRWRATGLDPEGIDLMAGDRTARLPFPERVTDAGNLRRVLALLARQARAQAGLTAAGGA